jgi:hypothetical protein
MFQANIVPGQGFVKLTIYEEKNRNVDGKLKTEFIPTDKYILGIILHASQREKEHWKQLEHPIDHVIVSSDALVRGDATNYLVGDDGRMFYIEGSKDSAGLSVSIAYYVQERFDMK